MKMVLLIVVLAALVLSGCASFWQAQGEASRTQAQAALRRAEAERQSAQAQIIDAEARGALAESQARALTTTINANADLTRQAISLADNGEYVVVFGAVAVAALVLALVVVAMHGRRPGTSAPMRVLPAGQADRVVSISAPDGRILTLVQEAGESWDDFMVQVQALSAVSAAQMLAAPKDGQR